MGRSQQWNQVMIGETIGGFTVATVKVMSDDDNHDGDIVPWCREERTPRD